MKSESVLISNKTMQRFCGLRAKALTLFGVAYFGPSGIWGGGHIVPPPKYLWVGWGKGSNSF